MSRLALPFAVLLIAASCGTKPPPTWSSDIQPMISANCAGCHQPNGIGPFDLTTYESFKSHAAVALAAVQSRTMPPWMPSSDSQPFVGSRQLADEQIQTLSSWIKNGMPVGDASVGPAKPTTVSSFMASQSIQIAAPYTPDTKLGTDDYHCFVLDPGLTQDMAVTAFNIVPGDRRVVHHVILYAVAPADQPKLQTLVDGGSNGGYTCFGSSEVDNAQMVGGWVPGTTETTFPDGTGVFLSAGTKIVMQVHYNMLQVQNATDQTTMQLQYAPTVGLNAAYIFPLLNNKFSIPPNVVQTATQTFDSKRLSVPDGLKVQIWGVLPHMHLHGTDISVVADNADGSQTTFVHIPKWQFQWQQMYFFQNPIELQKGVKMTLSCTFDNTQANQPIINGVQVTPQTLTWGEDTLNEMCLNFFYATVE